MAPSSFLKFYLKIDNSAVFGATQGHKEALSKCIRHLVAYSVDAIISARAARAAITR
jgi:hypothetical protein